MVVVAVAGGTGGVGRTIVETFVNDSSHQVIVLTRTAKADPILERCKQVEINYADVASLTRTLEEHGVHTIISAIGIYSDASSQSQLNLIRAAEQSSSTERFIPSEYSYIQTADFLPLDPGVQYFMDTADLLRETGLKYTRVIPGFFMDYWGMPHVRTNLQPFTFGIDMGSCQAAIPGDGNDVIGMTYTYDMAKVIVKLLDLNEWPEYSVVVGDDITYNQLLEIGEQVRGKKFQVVYDSLQKIKEGQVTVPPMPAGVDSPQEELKGLTAFVSRLTVAKVFDFPVEKRLNGRFPDLKLVTAREFIEDVWGGKP